MGEKGDVKTFANVYKARGRDRVYVKLKVRAAVGGRRGRVGGGEDEVARWMH